MINLKDLNKYIIIYIIFIKMILAYNYSGTNSLHNSTENDTLNFKCPLGTFYKPYAHPNDCTSYIICNDGSGTKFSCPTGFNFDVNTKMCKPKDEANCSNMETKPHDKFVKNITINTQHNDTIDCQRNLIGVFPHPFSNEKYLKCINGQLYENSCRSGQIFHLKYRMCENFINNTFAALPSTHKIDLPKDGNLPYLKCPRNINGNFVYPFDCHRYIKCLRSDTQIVKCSTDEVYNFRREICMPETRMDSNDHIECKKIEESNVSEVEYSSPLGIYCTPNETKPYPYADNWNQYVLCENGKIKMKWCPRNQVFIPEVRKCVNEEDALDYIT